MIAAWPVSAGGALLSVGSKVKVASLGLKTQWSENAMKESSAFSPPKMYTSPVIALTAAW